MPENFTIRKIGIIALLLIFLVITAAGKFSLGDISKFMEDAEGKAAIAIILSVLSITLGVIEYFFGYGNISSWFFNPKIIGPDADPAIVNVVHSFIRLLQPFYVVAILLVGIYFLFASSTPTSRAKAKSMFWRLIVSMVMVTASPYLFQIILNISAALTSWIANAGEFNIISVLTPFNIFFAAIVASFSDPTLIILAGSWILLLNGLIALMVSIRYVVLLILAMLFPFTIFLWYLDFPFTKGFGMSLMRWTFMWSFMSVVFVLVGVGAQAAMSNYARECSVMTLVVTELPAAIALIAKVLLGGGMGKGIVGGGLLGLGLMIGLLVEGLLNDWSCAMTIFLSLAGTLLMIAVPFMMIGLMKWIGGAMVLFGFANFKRPYGELFTLAGGVLAGMGPGAVIMYGTQAAFRKASFGTLAPGATTQGGVNRGILNNDARRQRITGLSPTELREFDEIRGIRQGIGGGTLQGSLLPASDRRLQDLEKKIGPDRLMRLNKFEEGVRNLGDLDKANYWNVRRFAEDFDKWEFRDALKKGGAISGGLNKISTGIKGAGSSVIRAVREGRVRETIKTAAKDAGAAAKRGGGKVIGQGSSILYPVRRMGGGIRSLTWKEKPIRESAKVGLDRIKGGEVWGVATKIKRAGSSVISPIGKVKDIIRERGVRGIGRSVIGTIREGRVMETGRKFVWAARDKIGQIGETAEERLMTSEYWRRTKSAGRGFKDLFTYGKLLDDKALITYKKYWGEGKAFGKGLWRGGKAAGRSLRDLYRKRFK